jgi:hypothetical protein
MMVTLLKRCIGYCCKNRCQTILWQAEGWGEASEVETIRATDASDEESILCVFK